VLNSVEDGYPISLLEGSLISATRTAASAALAARWLHEGGSEVVGFIGCGRINREILRFLKAIFPDIGRIALYDHVESASLVFAAQAKADWPDVSVEILPGYREVLSLCTLVSFATTSIDPYVGSADLPARGTILHVSLRDIRPEGILESCNIVDDVEHVCREGTSIALASGATGGRWKPNTALYDFIEGHRRAAELAGRLAIFSPFGLGALDVALASLVYDAARERGAGTLVENFVG
jgi:ornithine cyclodeaminase